MKTVNFLSLFGRLATSSHRHSARPARPFVRPSSLSISPLIRYENHRSLTGLDEPFPETSPSAAKRLELSFDYITPRNAGIARLSNEFQRKTSLSKLTGIIILSEISQNQPSTSESARFRRISQTQRIGSTPGIRQIPAHGFPRTSHRPPQPATARGPQPGRGLIVERLLGLIRVRGVPFYGPRALFILVIV